MMSHELRTPLNEIGSYALLMLDGIPSPVTEGQQDYLNRLRRASSTCSTSSNECSRRPEWKQGYNRTATRSNSMAQATLQNQKTIIANQKKIVSNQSKILKNQQGILKNQKRILSNQGRILRK